MRCLGQVLLWTGLAILVPAAIVGLPPAAAGVLTGSAAPRIRHIA
jgi:hypothetical protein